MDARPQLDIRQIHDDPDLVVWDYETSGDMLVVCFTGIGPDPSVVPSPEFIMSSTDNGKHNALFIVDPRRSWLNTPELPERIAAEIEAKAARMGAKRVVTLGHSMGGFMAAVLPAFTSVDVAVCLSPQLSIDPKIAPNERRWKEHRRNIQEIRIRNAADYVVPETKYYLYFGDHQREAQQRALIPEDSNAKFFLLPNMTHNTPQRMKRAGVLTQVIQYSFHARTHLLRRLLGKKLGAVQIEIEQDLPRAQAPNVPPQRRVSR